MSEYLYINYRVCLYMKAICVMPQFDKMTLDDFCNQNMNLLFDEVSLVTACLLLYFNYECRTASQSQTFSCDICSDPILILYSVNTVFLTALSGTRVFKIRQRSFITSSRSRIGSLSSLASQIQWLPVVIAMHQF